jgi:hypothetical protein
MVKEEIRVIGFDDGAFPSKSKELVPVVGAIFRGGKFLDGMLKIEIQIDGMDATPKLIKCINSSRHKQQLRVIMFDGITLGGFNMVNIKKVSKATKLPVIVINRKKPNLEKVKNALLRFKDFKKRWKCVVDAGKIKSLKIRDKKIFYQVIGIDDDVAEEIIILSSTRSYIPECLRVAHLIATAITRGESFGRA